MNRSNIASGELMKLGIITGKDDAKASLDGEITISLDSLEGKANLYKK